MKKLVSFLKVLVVLALAGFIIFALNFCEHHPTAYINNKDIQIGNVKLVCVEDGNPNINQGIHYIH